MIPAGFAYRAPADAAAAAALLAQDAAGSRILGGGTWLVPELSRGEASPRVIVDLSRAGLAAIEPAGDGLRVGAMATYSDVLASAAAAERAPLLARMAEAVTGGSSIRNQGTLGGSVAAARPQSDAPAALVACDAAAIVTGPGGERRAPVAELLAGPMRTTLARDELLTGFELPAMGGIRIGYAKLKRGASSWPIVTASAVVSGRAARVVLGGATATPLVVDVSAPLDGALHGALGGVGPTPAALAEAQRLVAAAVTEPWADELAPAHYRAAVAGPIARRALEMALASDGST